MCYIYQWFAQCWLHGQWIVTFWSRLHALIPLCKGSCLIGMLIRRISHFIYTQLSHPYTHKTEKLRVKFTCIEHLKPIEVSDCKGDYFNFKYAVMEKPNFILMLKVWKGLKKNYKVNKDFWTPDFFWKFNWQLIMQRG